MLSKKHSLVGKTASLVKDALHEVSTTGKEQDMRTKSKKSLNKAELVTWSSEKNNNDIRGTVQ